MFGKRKIDSVYDISKKDISKSFEIEDKILTIEVKDALYGKVMDKDKLLDEINVKERVEEIAKAIERTASKYNGVPNKIIIFNDEKNNESLNKDLYGDKENKADKNSYELINIIKPKWTLDDIYIDDENKEAIITAITMAKYNDKLFKEWGLLSNSNGGRATILNFWGPPGTGKSISAEAIANYLGKNLLIVNYSELESKYVGETPKNIKKIFKIAKEKDAVILFDEADSFLGKRLTNVSQSADYGVNITRSVMLMELEAFNNVVIFTTNLIDNYDDAFKRRILANIEFRLPNEIGRISIWKRHLPDTLPRESSVNENELARRYENLSGADIKDITILAATYAIQQNREMVTVSDFDRGHKIVSNRYRKDSKYNGLKVITETISQEEYDKEIARE